MNLKDFIEKLEENKEFKLYEARRSKVKDFLDDVDPIVGNKIFIFENEFNFVFYNPSIKNDYLDELPLFKDNPNYEEDLKDYSDEIFSGKGPWVVSTGDPVTYKMFPSWAKAFDNWVYWTEDDNYTQEMCDFIKKVPKSTLLNKIKTPAESILKLYEMLK